MISIDEPQAGDNICIVDISRYSEPSLAYILHIYYKSGATLTYSPNCALVVFFSSHNG